MKRILRIIGAALVFGIVCFGAGFLMQQLKVSTAVKNLDACSATLATAKADRLKEDGLLDLYRARAELAKSNFGLVSDDLVKARTELAGNAPVGELVDKASKAVTSQDLAAASDAIQAAIRSVEGTPAPAPSSAPTP